MPDEVTAPWPELQAAFQGRPIFVVGNGPSATLVKERYMAELRDELGMVFVGCNSSVAQFLRFEIVCGTDGIPTGRLLQHQGYLCEWVLVQNSRGTKQMLEAAHWEQRQGDKVIDGGPIDLDWCARRAVMRPGFNSTGCFMVKTALEIGPSALFLAGFDGSAGDTNIRPDILNKGLYKGRPSDQGRFIRWDQALAKWYGQNTPGVDVWRVCEQEIGKSALDTMLAGQIRPEEVMELFE